MYHYKKKLNKKYILILILIFCNIALSMNGRQLKMIINEQQKNINQLIEIAEKNKDELADSLAQIEDLNIKIVLLESILEEK